VFPSSSSLSDLLQQPSVLKAIYRKDPVAFCKYELGFEPSIDQVKLFNDLADLEKLNLVASAGRGAGKTWIGAAAVAWSIATLPDIYGSYPCTILGGSGKQSKLMNRYLKAFTFKSPLLFNKLQGRPGLWRTEFSDGSWVEALTASENAVRGPHPEMLVLDEAAQASTDLMESALGQVAGTKHGRILILSTGHKSSGFFRDIWDNAEAKDFIRHGPWPLTNCPWVKPSYIERARKIYSPAKFKVEILGEFAKTAGAVFDPSEVDRCVVPAFTVNPNYDSHMGVDWGLVISKSVVTTVQYHDDKLWVPGPQVIMEHIPYPDQQMRIASIAKASRVLDISGDSSHRGENQRLERMGFDVEDVKFASAKGPIVELLIMLMSQNRIVISSDHTMLISQLKKLERIALPSTREVFKKVDDDSVDSLVCAVYMLWKDGSLESHDTENDKFITLS